MGSNRLSDAERLRLQEALLLPGERLRVAAYVRLGYSAKRIAELMGVPFKAVEAVKEGQRA